MNKLYIITGPAGVGKSTVSKEIAKKSDKSALIEGDEIYQLVCGGYVSAWKEGNHLDIFWENCIDLIRNFLDNGYDVVFNYIIGKKKVEELRQEFGDSLIKFVAIFTDENTLVERDKQRPEDCQMGERCLVLLNQLRNQNYDQENILDTTNLSVEETVKEILEDDRFILKAQANSYLGKMVKVKIDRPLNSKHPKHGFVYEVNYGYVPNTISGDGEELDCYVLGVDKPLATFEGKCIAIIHRTNDNDDKLIIVPKGINYTDEEIRKLTNFQEQYFESIIIRK